ncbi:MAG: hypothetical protein IK120_02430 [Muribaculaceae bacterium]|nr:hypothetical protein [Muribaculaceae bacterium]
MDESLNLTPQEQPVAVENASKRLSIGLPACNPHHDRRFPLTPEAVEILIEGGYEVNIERNAAAVIHYTDEDYTRRGATIADRSSVLASDVVISLVALSSADIGRMRRNGVLLTLSDAIDSKIIDKVLGQRLTTVFLDLVRDKHGNYPVADLLAEIDGRAAMMKANELLADSCHGKGILIGGVSGVMPCETVILGGGIAAMAAAESAVGLGSIVRIFDNDVFALNKAACVMSGKACGLFPHPKVLRTALQTADIIIVASTSIDWNDLNVLKSGVVIVDISNKPGNMFATLPQSDLLTDSPYKNKGRVCYVNAGKTVPRTIAMAFGSAVQPIFRRIMRGGKEIVDALTSRKEWKPAVATLAGRVTCRELAERTGLPEVDINIFLNLS